jgi:hypothetical protein
MGAFDSAGFVRVIVVAAVAVRMGVHGTVRVAVLVQMGMQGVVAVGMAVGRAV